MDNFPVPESAQSDVVSVPELHLAPPPVQATARGGGGGVMVRKTKGRLKRAKNKRPVKISGLDLLHSKTLLSTSTRGKWIK